MSKQFFPFLLLLAITIFSACEQDVIEPGCCDEPDLIPPEGTTAIAANPQVTTGDPAAGQAYLYNGGFLNSGIPTSVFQIAFSGDGNLLNREGANADIPYLFSANLLDNGVEIVSVNCLLCHAQELNGELIVGLGNSLGDFTTSQADQLTSIDLAMQLLGYSNGTPEWEAYAPFRRAAQVTGPLSVVDIQGVNTAAQFTYILSSYHDPQHLEWLDTPLYEIDPATATLPSDVPAWWLMKKKTPSSITV